MVLLMKLEAVEHARFRALAQILINQDAGSKAFDEYMKIAFPYMDASKERDKKEAKEVLKEWLDQGAFNVRPLPMPKMKSKLKTRMLKRTKPKTREEENALYEKIGQSIPIK